MIGGPKSSKYKFHQNKRSVQQVRLKRSARLRDFYGAVNTKRQLRSSLLNVDGLKFLWMMSSVLLPQRNRI